MDQSPNRVSEAKAALSSAEEALSQFDQTEAELLSKLMTLGPKYIDVSSASSYLQTTISRLLVIKATALSFVTATTTLITECEKLLCLGDRQQES